MKNCESKNGNVLFFLVLFFIMIPLVFLIGMEIRDNAFVEDRGDVVEEINQEVSGVAEKVDEEVLFLIESLVSSIVAVHGEMYVDEEMTCRWAVPPGRAGTVITVDEYELMAFFRRRYAEGVSCYEINKKLLNMVDKTNPFNQQLHPEIREGEVWLTNDSGHQFLSTFKTKRTGRLAYDVGGEVVDGLRPVFVSREEYERMVLND